MAELDAPPVGKRVKTVAMVYFCASGSDCCKRLSFSLLDHLTLRVGLCKGRTFLNAVIRLLTI